MTLPSTIGRWLATARRYPGVSLAVAALALGAVTWLFTTMAGRGSDLLLAIDVSVKLAVVVVLAYLSVWGLRRLSGGGRFATRRRPLQIVDSLPLGNQRSVQVVRVGSQTLILGSTPHQITKLGELTEADAALWDPAAPSPEPFAATLHQFVTRIQ